VLAASIQRRNSAPVGKPSNGVSTTLPSVLIQGFRNTRDPTAGRALNRLIDHFDKPVSQ
jgi:hypothetical protein